MSEIIFHHYPQSPVAEKVRIIFGIKNLSWRSVLIPRLPPKPDLMPLTGGYRQTPVMQIGADVYCDSQCIIRELERRFPEPTLFPGASQGMAWGVSRWTDGPLFNTLISVVFAAPVEDMPDQFINDRMPLYFPTRTSLEDLKACLDDNLASLRAQFGWMDDRLTKRNFMLGALPGLPDALAYHLVWFLRGRYRKGPEFLAEFKNLNRWEEAIADIGHGISTDLTADEALAVALETASSAPEEIDSMEAQDMKPGDPVRVVPDNGSASITGALLSLARDEVVIRHHHPRVANVAIHFPRVGYRIRHCDPGALE